MEALAGELGCDLYKLNMSELGSKYLHETGENIAKMMKEIKEQAKKSERPIILFLDELDSLAKARTGDAKSHELEELNTILQNINNLQDHNIILAGATNRKDLIDGAILRPGRFAEHIFVHNPDEKAREALLTRFLKERPKAEEFLKDKKQISDAVDNLEGLSNAEIKYIVDNSARLGFEDDMSNISKNHIEKAIKEFKASREQH
jgi:SpoVK/Ycf46/Vps4 family AAA+-type ATPase